MLNILDLHPGPYASVQSTRERLADLAFEGFELTPAGACLGAEVRGVDLGKPLPPDLAKELRRALVEFKVLFFRDQDIDVRAQGEFASLFGELEEHPFLPSNTDEPHVIRFEKSEETRGVENMWHSDVSWRRVPSFGSVLRAIEIPPLGGDTLWADMEAAYEDLTDEWKARIEGKLAVHDFANSFGAAMDPETRAKHREQYPPAEHPVVRTHPESGRRCIYVNGVFTSHIVGVSEQESDEILSHLYAQAHVPEYHVRFCWSPGAVAIWDNRSTQHYASSDYYPQRRVMERVTIIGDRPA
jgi:taurine dioxygenase